MKNSTPEFNGIETKAKQGMKHIHSQNFFDDNFRINFFGNDLCQTNAIS